MTADRSSRGGTSGTWENGRVTVRRIAYQGEPGANSHLVCKQHYPEAEAVACASFEDVFAAVEGGDAELVGALPRRRRGLRLLDEVLGVRP